MRKKLYVGFCWAVRASKKISADDPIFIKPSWAHAQLKKRFKDYQITKMAEGGPI
jgi:hypothetical protein